MSTFTYYFLKFTPPGLLSPNDFYTLKQKLNKNRKYKISSNTNPMDFFGIYLIFMGVAGIGFLITLLHIHKWVETIGGIMFIIGAVGSIFILPTIRYYVEFLIKKKKYYSKLKYDILNSADYQHFFSKRKLIDKQHEYFFNQGFKNKYQ